MNTNNITIRETTLGDFSDIMIVIKLAFDYHKEAELAADLLADPTGEPVVSLLAFSGDEAVGHILFTRAYFAHADFDGYVERQQQPMMHILAPLAVKPEYQRQGVGGMLIRAGVERLRELGSHLAFVLGHRDYYPRHGFVPDAGEQGYPAPYAPPVGFEDCWMVRPVGPAGFEIGKGAIACCEAMDKPEHWRDDEADR
ncbi:MAG: N-acetyltransferase [Alistipes sp.]|jgi:putative acetyltransferase|nr:N-acetyltransferase [Alistipes sp.]